MNTPTPAGNSAPLVAAKLAAEDLHVVFGHGADRVHAVRGLSFAVQRNECFGIVGESGSGKSTLLRAICGLAPITSGELTIDGEPVRPRAKDFARRVQMVFQDPYSSLHPRHTVDRVLSEPLAIHGFSDREDRIIDALRDVGLSASFRFRFPHQLSGGQRQRIAIARALILGPEILLLDEPTSSLDASVQAEVLNLLTRLRSEKGLTYVLVSHDLAIVDYMCERLIVMQSGEVVERLDASALASADLKTEYTRMLLLASQGFARDPASSGAVFARSPRR